MKDRAMSKEDFDQLQKNKTSKANTVTAKQIDELIENSEIDSKKVMDKCTVVTCRLPSGFIIVEFSACVDPANYDHELGTKICMERIKAKIWELEGYMLQSHLAK